MNVAQVKNDFDNGVLLSRVTIGKLIEYALAKTVLEDNEQYRLQIAAICTAAIGYCTADEPVHFDYRTPALADVQALYVKYAAQRAMLQEVVDNLTEAAATFRHYEKSHRDKNTADSLRKAEANAMFATKFEATIAKVTGGGATPVQEG